MSIAQMIARAETEWLPEFGPDLERAQGPSAIEHNHVCIPTFDGTHMVAVCIPLEWLA